jgi:hypothetical protein
MTTLNRIGTFLILVGLALFFIFIGSVMSKQVTVVYLLVSLAALFAGYQLRRNRTVNDSGRFATIRRIRDRQGKKEDKEKDPHE